MTKYSVNENYFEIIDTKDKAYLLGLLYADGNVRKNQVELYISEKDEWLLHKMKTLLEANNEIRSARKNRRRFSISRKKMCDDLTKLGCTQKKSKIIELPELSNKDLYLAFLLGFYDGDGIQNRTAIVCGSLKFLKQLKVMFSISSKIIEKTSKNTAKYKISGTAFMLHLGAKIIQRNDE